MITENVEMIAMVNQAGISVAEAEEAINRLALVIQDNKEQIEKMTEEIQEAKKQAEKMVPCRICGTRYISKAEAKACARSHDWQNRRGRR